MRNFFRDVDTNHQWPGFCLCLAVGVTWHASVWPKQQYQDEPLTIRTDVVKRGSQRKQFDCEPFLEVGAFCESHRGQGREKTYIAPQSITVDLQVLRRIESSLREDESGRPRDRQGSGEESGGPWATTLAGEVRST